MKVVMKMLCVLYVILVLPLSARLGETKDQLIARYGEVDQEAAPLLLFKKAGFHVAAKMRNGKCGEIIFCSLVSMKDLSETEIKVLLGANAGKSTWEPMPDSFNPVWKLADGSALAGYLRGQQKLVVTSMDEHLQSKVEREAKEEESVKDF